MRYVLSVPTGHTARQRPRQNSFSWLWRQRTWSVLLTGLSQTMPFPEFFSLMSCISSPATVALPGHPSRQEDNYSFPFPGSLQGVRRRKGHNIIAAENPLNIRMSLNGKRYAPNDLAVFFF